jgi:hypothetical protein
MDDMKGKAGIPRGLGVRSGASLGGGEEGLLESELESEGARL